MGERVCGTGHALSGDEYGCVVETAHWIDGSYGCGH